MDERRDCHAEWSKSDRDGEILYAILYMWNLKGNDANELIIEKATHRLREWTYGCQGEGTVREFGIDIYTRRYLKWITNKDCSIARGTLLNIMWQPGWKGSLKENGYMYMYGWVPLLSTWNYHNFVTGLYSNTQQKVKKKNRYTGREAIEDGSLFWCRQRGDGKGRWKEVGRRGALWASTWSSVLPGR